MIQYKATIYSPNGDLRANIADNIENVLDFSEGINTGQGELVVKIRESFSSTRFSQGDIILVSLYSDNFKSGLPRYSGILKGVRRKMNSTGQFIELKFYGIFDFMNDVNITKTYTGGLSTVINEIIADLGTENDITKAIGFLGSKKLKNLVSDTTPIDYTANDEDLLTVLKNVFNSIDKKFFINMKGEIIEESSELILIPAGKKGVEIEIDEDGETNIKINNNQYLKNYLVNSPIKILNIEQEFNLEGQIIQEITFNDFETTIRLGKTLSFGLK